MGWSKGTTVRGCPPREKSFQRGNGKRGTYSKKAALRSMRESRE